MKRGGWILGVLSVAAVVAAGCGGAGGGKDGAARVELAVTDRGFEPAEVRAKKGVPLTLVVTRKTDATCAKEIVIADQNIRQDLPLNESVEVTFTPGSAGEVRFACGMDMITGKVVVQ